MSEALLAQLHTRHPRHTHMDPPRSSDSSNRSGPPSANPSEQPHPGHEDRLVHTASFRKPVPFPAPIGLPSPTIMSEISPSSAPQTPSILSLPSSIVVQAQPSTSHATQPPSSPVAGPSQPIACPSQSITGPSQLRPPAKRRQTGSQQESSEEEQMEQPPQENPTSRAHSILHYGTGGAGNDHSNGNGNSVGEGYTASPRRPTRAVSYRERDTVGQTDRYPGNLSLKGLPPGPGPSFPIPGGIGSVGELNQGALGSRPSELDWIIPTAVGGGSMNGLRPRSEVASQVPTFVTTLVREKTVEERLTPTLEEAERERERAALRAKSHSWALNVAIGMQVVLGALTTGVAAATTGRDTSIATSVLGGLSTLAASYLAKTRGSGEPEASARRCTELDSFVRDCKAFIMDKGHHIGPADDKMIERYRRRYEEILGNGIEGVADEVHMKQRLREKNDLPV